MRLRIYQLAGAEFPNDSPETLQLLRMAKGFRDCGVSSAIVYPLQCGPGSWKDVCSTYGLRGTPSRRRLLGFHPVVRSVSCRTSQSLAKAIQVALDRGARPWREIQTRLAGCTWTDRAREISAFVTSLADPMAACDRVAFRP